MAVMEWIDRPFNKHKDTSPVAHQLRAQRARRGKPAGRRHAAHRSPAGEDAPVMEWIDRFFNRHKGARRSALVWAMCLITVVVLRASDPDTLVALTPASATFLTAVIGMLSVVIGFYQWSRDRDK